MCVYVTLEYPPLIIGPSLPFYNKCYNQFLFYFNILGNNDSKNVHLMAFTKTTKGYRNDPEILILNKIKQTWEYQFMNCDKLTFPVNIPFTVFGHTFLVIVSNFDIESVCSHCFCLFVCVCVCVCLCVA